MTLAGDVDKQITGLLNIASLAVSPDGQTIAAGGEDGAYVARVWRVSEGTHVRLYDPEQDPER